MSLSEFLLAVIAFELLLFFFALLGKYTGNKKKRHFKMRLAKVETDLIDLEFQREKLKMIREDMRGQYDQINEKSVLAGQKLDEEKKKTPSDETVVTNLTNLIERFKPDLEYLKKQMDGMDNELNGEGNPDSLENKLQGYRTLKLMIKEHMKKF